MFCPKCGTELPEDSIFCENCGTKIIEYAYEEKDTPPKRRPVGSRNRNSETGSDRIRKKKSGLPVPLIVGAAAAVILLAIFFLRSKGKGGDGVGSEVQVMASEDSSNRAAASRPEEKERTETETQVLDLSGPGWNQLENGDWYYVHEDGKPAVNEWVDDCYLGDDGIMLKDQWVDGYYVGSDGVWVKDKLPAVAADLSTADHALATDFEWFLDYELLGGEYQGQLVSDRSLTKTVTKDQQALLQGGWKAYMYCADEGASPEDGARYFNAEINSSGDDFAVTMNWKYMFDAVSGQSIEESGSDLFKGNWKEDGTVSVQSDYAMVTFDTFLINQDSTAEYALGTFYWISGETCRIALMRVRES